MKLDLTPLGDDKIRFLKTIGANTKAYLVGGLVRDLLLGRAGRSIDLDIMVCDDVFGFLQGLKENWAELFPDLPAPRKVVSFKKYFTAKLLFEEDVLGLGEQIDFSGARRETYPSSGSNPVVEQGSLEEDLGRRDFSINALAVSLSAKDFSELRDNFGGLSDLQNSSLEVLHEKSFEDDPARLLRAVRFSGRLNFELGAKTAELFSIGVQRCLMQKISGRRHFEELRKLLSEEAIEPVLKRYLESGLFASSSPLFSALKPEHTALAESVEERFVGLFTELLPEQFELVLKQFEVERKFRKKLLEMFAANAH